MLSRLSMGLTDALQWLGIKGHIPTAAGAAAEDEAAAAGEQPGQQYAAAAAAHGGGGAAQLDRPALSPIAASPTLEEGGSCSSKADASPLPECSIAVTALEELPVEEESSAAGGSPAPVAQAAADEAAAAEAASTPAEQAEAAVEQLQEHLAAKLQLHEQDEEQQLEVAAAAEAAEAAAPEEDEEAEELTPLQQLLLLCGQEVRPAATCRHGQCSIFCCCAVHFGQPEFLQQLPPGWVYAILPLPCVIFTLYSACRPSGSSCPAWMSCWGSMWT
jgi:hypothetical protein